MHRFFVNCWLLPSEGYLLLARDKTFDLSKSRWPLCFSCSILIPASERDRRQTERGRERCIMLQLTLLLLLSMTTTYALLVITKGEERVEWHLTTANRCYNTVYIRSRPHPRRPALCKYWLLNKLVTIEDYNIVCFHCRWGESHPRVQNNVSELRK